MKIKLTKNLLTIIKTTIIYGTILKKHVHCCAQYTKARVNAMYRSLEYLLSPVTVQDIVPPRHKKNKHTPDNLCGKCPMIFPFFFFYGHIDLSTLNVVRLIHSSTSPAAASHISLYTC